MSAFAVRGWVAVLLAGCGLAAAQQPATLATTVTWQRITIPMPEAGSAGLSAMLVTPQLPGKHPLLLLVPGPTLPAKELRQLGPGRYLPEATWFARRGWEVAIVLRRGFGASGGTLADDLLHVLPYTPATIQQVERANAADLRVAYAALIGRPEVDATQVLAVGSSTGGDAMMWLSEPAPPGYPAVSLNAVISFNGGWATVADYKISGKVHGIPDVVEPAFRQLGTQTRTPMLWLESPTGGAFGIKSAEAAKAAFTAAGGVVQLHLLTRVPDKETSLFDQDAAEWGPVVEQFLAGLGLPWQALLPPAGDLPVDAVSEGYKEETRKGYLQYQRRGPAKAFARSPRGDWAFSTGKVSQKAAEQDALKLCERKDCVIEASEE